jgi:hypothetical protein
MREARILAYARLGICCCAIAHTLFVPPWKTISFRIRGIVLIAAVCEQEDAQCHFRYHSLGWNILGFIRHVHVYF